MEPRDSSVESTQPAHRREDFETTSGSYMERMVFNHRRLIVAFCLLLTVFLGFEASRLTVNASFEKMMPRSSEFILNYLDNENALRGLGNSVRIVVEAQGGDIYDPAYLNVLREINDKVYTIRGVDRSFVKSIWMPVVRWIEVTPEGFQGGPVMPEDYDASAGSIGQLRVNVARAGIIGSLVANDQRSSMIFVPLLEKYADSGKPLDVREVRSEIEKIRAAYAKKGVTIHVIGFAQLVGDLMEGILQISLYFLAAAAIAMLVIFAYTRCARSTALVIFCSVTAVVWQLGIVRLLGAELDPYSILVPFLVFAIGVSHGAQKMNGVMQDIGRGMHQYVAARMTFRRLFLAGLTALLADAVGFGVLGIIDIPAIRGLALAAGIGVAVLIFTNLVFLPVILSYTGVSAAAATRSLNGVEQSHYARLLMPFCRPRGAAIALCVTTALSLAGLALSANLQIGDLSPGAPELRVDSRYNRDNAYVTSHYQLSTDRFAVIVKTPPGGIGTFKTLLEMDRLEEALRDLPGVQTTTSVASLVRRYTAAGIEGDPRWMTISRDPFTVSDALNNVYVSNPELLNGDRSVAPVVAFLSDHKAATLDRVVKTAQAFATEHNDQDLRFLLAAGSAGIEAATNIAVEKANRTMLLLVYCRSPA